jgi:hypothetical protein
MSYLTYNGKMVTSNNKYVTGILGAPPLTELFSFHLTGTNAPYLNVYGAALVPGDSASWNMGDTSASVPNPASPFDHTYSGSYVSPADKRVSFSLYNPSHAEQLSIGYSGPNNHMYSLDLSNFPTLAYLSLAYNDLSTLNLTNNTDLTTGLTCNYTALTGLDLTTNASIGAVTVTNSSTFKTITLANSGNYPNLYQINVTNDYMSAIDVSNFIDYIYNHRTQFTYGYGWGINLSGVNASINIAAAQKIVRMERYNGAATWTSGYNVPNGMMRNYFSMGYLPSDITSYFMHQTDNGINRLDFYGNTYTTTDSSLVITFRYSLDTSISNFQSSDITWNIVTRYKRDSGDAYTTIDNTNYVCTSNTSGMTFQKDVSLYLSHVLGNKQFGIQFQITLTDNRANKNQVAGDSMTLRATPMLNDNPFTETILVGGNETDGYYPNFIRDFVRAKWGA